MSELEKIPKGSAVDVGFVLAYDERTTDDRVRPMTRCRPVYIAALGEQRTAASASQETLAVLAARWQGRRS